MTDKNPIPSWDRVAVDARTAAQMMSCGRSTFFKRVKEGIYPPAGPDGRWNVDQLRALHAAQAKAHAEMHAKREAEAQAKAKSLEEVA